MKEHFKKIVKLATLPLLKLSDVSIDKEKGIKNSLLTDVGTKNGSAREIWLENALKKIPPGSKILDAGAGECQYKRFCPHLEYVSQDFAQYDGKGNSEGLQMDNWDNLKLDIVSDIVSIPVPDNSFDAIMCIEVFEHIPEPAKAVKEFSRILKPGGKLILTAPFCSLNHFAPYYFANGYSKYWYEKILPEYGFSIKETEFNGNFFEYLAQEIRRVAKVQSTYTKLNLTKNILFRLSKLHFLRTLDKLSKAGQKSEELLCFGIHVLAEKK